MGIKILRQRFKSPPLPEGCRWCGMIKQEHGTAWVPSKKWHTYGTPTTEQIQARTLARHSATRHLLPYREPTS